MRLLPTIVAVVASSVSVFGQANLWLRQVNPVNEYYHVPMLLSPVLELSGMVENIGNDTATNVQITAQVYNSASAVVYTSSSPVLPFLIASDSAAFTIAAFSPPAIEEEYIVEYTVTMSGVDPDPSDNVILLIDTFYVTDSVFARDDGEVYLPVATGGNSGGFLGQQFVLTQPAMISSVSGSLNNSQSCNIAFVVFSYDNGVPGLNPIATTDTFTVGPFADWITFPLNGGPFALPADTFVIAARQFSNNNIDLSLSTGRYTPGSTWVRWAVLGGWVNIEFFGEEYGYPFMLRANLTESTTAVADSLSDNFSIAASPNPTADLFTLHYNFSPVTDADVIVYNALGEIVSCTPLPDAHSGQITIDLSDQPAGIYMVCVGAERKTLEIVVE
jgi:hypothetical protein